MKPSAAPWFLVLLSLLLVWGGSHRAARASQQPNIIFILADDLGWKDVGYHGSEIHTPNIDRLAASGVRLEQFYALPMCTPTRGCLMTGRYPIRYGLQSGVIWPWSQYGLSLQERTLPQALREAGYETAIAGKWHLGHHDPAYLPTRRGFEHQYGLFLGEIDYFTHRMSGRLDWHRDDRGLREEGYTTPLIGQEAERLITQRDPSRPLFLYVPFNAPHLPLQAPDSYLQLYPEIASPQRRTLAAMVTCMDDAIGRILAAVEAQGMAGNTLIVFSSDNGGVATASNAPLRGGKLSLYEGGVRVCAAATWPGQLPAGAVVQAPLHMTDWYPTLLNLAGAPLVQPLPLDGRDLWPTLTAGAPSPHDEILLNLEPGQGAIRQGDWKLIMRASGTAIPAVGYELYDLAHDPSELYNAVSRRPDVVDQLAARLREYGGQAVTPLGSLAEPQPPGWTPPGWIWGEPLAHPPTAAGDVSASVLGATSMRVAWSDNSDNEDEFRVVRAGPGGALRVVPLGAGVTVWTDSDVVAATTYTYRIVASNAAGDTVSGSVTVTAGVPLAPANLAAGTVSPGAITLWWTDTSNNEESFLVERAPDGVSFEQVVVLGPNITTCTDAAVTGDTVYTYRLSAVNQAGRSEYSNTASASASSPAAPDSLTAAVLSPSEIRLSWRDASTDEDGFLVERDDGTGYAEIGSADADATGYTDGTVAINSTYRYRIRATNAAGPSAYSNVATAATLPPPAPTGLAAAILSPTSIRLSWTDNSTDETGFKIERRSGADDFAPVATTEPNAVTYTNLDLVPGTVFTYRVYCENVIGASGYSNTATASTTAPAAPGGLSATVLSPSSVRLAWTDASIDETGFTLERRAGGEEYAPVAALAANATTFTDDLLAPDATYTYRVRATSPAGDSDYSNTAEATPRSDLPAAPSDLVPTLVSFAAIRLTWVDNGANESAFRIERKSRDSAFIEIATVPADAVTYSDRGPLAVYGTYTYRVRASNPAGDSAYSNEASVALSPPAAPAGLAAATVSSTQIRLTWTDTSPDETGFKIERKRGTGLYAQIVNRPAGETAYDDTALAPNSTYTYRMRSYNAVGHSAYTAEAAATTLPNPPLAPTRLLATAVSTSQVNLSWPDVAGETGYRLERKSGPMDGPGTYTLVASPAVNAIRFSDTGLGAGATYTYRLRAVNAGGESPFSPQAQALTVPPVPGGLRATAVSPLQIEVTWDPAPGAEYYDVQRRLGSGPPILVYSTAVTLRAPARSLVDTSGLRPGTTYTYHVRARNASGASPYSGEVSATTSLVPPAAPVDLTAQVVAGTQVRLTWRDASTNEAGFRLERRDADQPYALRQSLAAGATTFLDGAVTPGRSYSYRVQAVNPGGPSAYSNEVTLTLPAMPGTLTATAVSSTRILLNWIDPRGDTAGFKIERKRGTGLYAQIVDLPAGQTAYEDAALAPSARYTYRMRSYNGSGNSAYTPEAAATTLPLPPPAPTGLVATGVSASRVNLSWPDVAGETGYRLERKSGPVDGPGTYTLIASPEADAVRFSDAGLGAGATYTYRLRAVNAGGESPFSPEVQGLTVPPVPGALRAASSTPTQVDLSWNAVPGAAAYDLQRALGPGTGSLVYATVTTVQSPRHSHSDTYLLRQGTTYTYRVRARNASGASAYSGGVTVTTRLVPPAAPADLSARVLSASQIRLTWRDLSANEAGFRLERREAGLAYELRQNLAPGSTGFTDSEVTAGKTYTYRVRAFNTGNVSAYSNEVTLTVAPPAAPGGLTAVAISSTQVRLTWTERSANEAGFKIERRKAGGAYVQIAVVLPNVTTYTDSGLTPGTSYVYRVRAYNPLGDSPYTAEVSVRTRVSDP